MGLFVFDEKDRRLDVSDSLDIIKCVADSGELITTGMFVKYSNGTTSSLGLVVQVARSIDEAIGVVVDAPAFTIGSNESVFAVQRSGKCIVAAEAGESFSSVTQYVSIGENGKAKSETLAFRGYRVLDTVDSTHAVIWFEDRSSGIGLFMNRYKQSFINTTFVGDALAGNTVAIRSATRLYDESLKTISCPFIDYNFIITGDSTIATKQNLHIYVSNVNVSFVNQKYKIDVVYSIHNVSSSTISGFNIYCYIYTLHDLYDKLF